MSGTQLLTDSLDSAEAELIGFRKSKEKSHGDMYDELEDLHQIWP